MSSFAELRSLSLPVMPHILAGDRVVFAYEPLDSKIEFYDHVPTRFSPISMCIIYGALHHHRHHHQQEQQHATRATYSRFAMKQAKNAATFVQDFHHKFVAYIRQTKRIQMHMTWYPHICSTKAMALQAPSFNGHKTLKSEKRNETVHYWDVFEICTVLVAEKRHRRNEAIKEKNGEQKKYIVLSGFIVNGLTLMTAFHGNNVSLMHSMHIFALSRIWNAFEARTNRIEQPKCVEFPWIVRRRKRQNALCSLSLSAVRSLRSMSLNVLSRE